MVAPEIIQYLIPAFILALVGRMFAGHGLASTSLILFVGVFVHECLHFLVGALLNAKPTHFSVFPKEEGGRYQLGHVCFANLRWYNAIWVAMAPLLGVLLFAEWRVNATEEFTFVAADIPALIVIAQVLLSSIPSAQDFRIALRSWPLILLMGYIAWYWIR